MWTNEDDENKEKISKTVWTLLNKFPKPIQRQGEFVYITKYVSVKESTLAYPLFQSHQQSYCDVICKRQTADRENFYQIFANYTNKKIFLWTPNKLEFDLPKKDTTFSPKLLSTKEFCALELMLILARNLVGPQCMADDKTDRISKKLINIRALLLTELKRFSANL